MMTRRLGRTDVLVSPLAFGAAPIGNLYTAVDDEDAAAAVEAAWTAGVRYFDTAPHYGLGLSERRLGAALAGRPRADFAISTKVGRLLVTNDAPTGSDLASGFDVDDRLTRRYDFTADGVLRSLDASLARLGMDRVDIVYVHDPDEYLDEAIGEAIPALLRLREEGVVGAVGVGMNHCSPLQRVVAQTDVDVIMVAGRWTLLDRSAGPLLGHCAGAGVAVAAAAPFNSGLLATGSPGAHARYDYRAAPSDLLERAEALAAACARRGVVLPHAALQFPMRSEAVSCVVVGMRSAAEVLANSAWANRPLPPDLWPDLGVEEGAS